MNDPNACQAVYLNAMTNDTIIFTLKALATQSDHLNYPN